MGGDSSGTNAAMNGTPTTRLALPASRRREKVGMSLPRDHVTSVRAVCVRGVRMPGATLSALESRGRLEEFREVLAACGREASAQGFGKRLHLFGDTLA